MLCGDARLSLPAGAEENALSQVPELGTTGEADGLGLERALVEEAHARAADGQRRARADQRRVVVAADAFNVVARAAVLHADARPRRSALFDGRQQLGDAEAVHGDDVPAGDLEADGAPGAGTELCLFAEHRADPHGAPRAVAVVADLDEAFDAGHG